jgi:cephalosporin hydroxylase
VLVSVGRLTPRAAARGVRDRARRLAARRAVRAFNRVYYESPDTWPDTTWLGVPVQKAPTDLWSYQEIMHRVRPSLVVETGTRYGGSARYLGDLCRLLDRGRVVSIDVDPDAERPPHPRVSYVVGSSTDPSVLERVRAEAAGEETVMVILDSDHSREHVLAELRGYADLVTPGSYLIVEDTNVNGNPVFPDHGPGPMEAVEAFLGEDARFAVDTRPERLLLTFNPRGYLRRER